MSALEIIAVIVNVLGVWLTARRIRWCWPVNVVAVLLYAWIFFSVKLYSDMLLQLVFVVLQFYGWWQWSKGGSNQGRVRIECLPFTTAVSSCLAGAAGAFALGWVMHRYTDAALPWLDAALTAFSLVASFWAARKYVASWWLWIILDTAYAGLFLYKALYLTAGLYAGFVLLAIYGLLAWQRELHDEPAALAAGRS
ncbi:nicotinamide riboside transporter PnuC [Metapseudomonas otitidis]|uniref:nicotinamide riboside transporter PnuC n=1 Tax=Metapseudomonas otitidis TaxID=319939 RepID=UPI00227AB5BC|nr:nicotinamide riboside transporter PnuC [Pseudomonas otitidis]WAF83268.1 nicotinamide riboside transporter PnuC [Pseudomonas otitidis]